MIGGADPVRPWQGAPIQEPFVFIAPDGRDAISGMPRVVPSKPSPVKYECSKQHENTPEYGASKIVAWVEACDDISGTPNGKDHDGYGL